MRFGHLLITFFILSLGAKSAFAGEGSPFRAEVEIYSGGLVGDSVGSTFNSVTKGNYGTRLSLGFTRFLNWELNYGFSNQPTMLTSSNGPAAITSNNWNSGSSNFPINIYNHRRATIYVSPSFGFVRTGGREFSLMDVQNGLGTAPLPIDTGLSFNLGAGVKIYPTKRVGFRLHFSDIVTRDTQGSLDTTQLLDLSNGTQVDPT